MYLRFWFKARSTPHPGNQPVTIYGRPGKSASTMDFIRQRRQAGSAHMPQPSSFRFDDIMSAVETQDFRSSIDAIAVICAKSRMSLADAHEMHRTPHICESNHRPRPARALSIVPEVNSSSEASTSDDGQDTRRSDDSRIRSNSCREISISSVPGLRKLSVKCQPIVGLSGHSHPAGWT